MATGLETTYRLPARGVIAPVFMALGIAAGLVALCVDSRVLVWLGLGCLTLGLSFSHYTRRLLDHAGLRSPALPSATTNKGLV